MKRVLKENKNILISIMLMSISVLWTCILLMKGIVNDTKEASHPIQYLIICILASISFNIMKRRHGQ